MPQEYLTDLFYPSRFYDFMSPVLLNYLAALHGFPPRPLNPGFTYCELGCGGASTTLLLAAANPQGRFFGVDINPEHIAYAREEARLSKLSNIEFLEKDLNVIENHELPEFDFITIHGMYSWVGEATRQHLLQFINNKLKPGGLVMLSYNAMPGSSMIQPIRDMMLAYTLGMEDAPLLEKVQEGIKYLRYLCEHDAGFFVENPLAKSAIENYLERDDHYLAHEFFNQHWKPFYFIEVAQHMAEAELSFVGTLPIASNYLESSIPSVFHDFFKGAPDRVTLERHKAFVRNDRFRRDVYIKAADWSLAEEKRPPLFQDFYFGTEYSSVSQEVVLENGKEQVHLEFRGEPRKTVQESLCQIAQNLAQLQQTENLKNHSSSDVLEAVNLLILGGEFRAFAQPAKPAAPINAPLSPEKLHIPCAFNQRILEYCHQSEEAGVYLASPVLGDGLLLSLLEALLLYGLTQVPLEAIPQWAWMRLDSAGKSLNVQGEAINDQQTQIELLQTELDQLLTMRLGKFFELGLITT
ncbi:class I SAM-dependent methyltransferase [Candidatus Venteria ishoeyi]|nr:class I SAM-dependent methyltransferase [Candidatus Venteria ishoeyi]